MELNRRGRRKGIEDKGKPWSRYREDGTQVVCYHDETQWCQECIAQPKEVEVDLPDGRKSKGFILGNFNL